MGFGWVERELDKGFDGMSMAGTKVNAVMWGAFEISDYVFCSSNMTRGDLLL